MTIQDILIALAKERATMAGVDPVLCCAVVEQESYPPWNQWCSRYEPGFFTKYIEKMTNLTPTEARNRATSWGLMQLMGETAREEGYTTYLEQLIDPQIGLDRGLIHLKRMLVKANGDVHAALQFWNGGSNPNYASEVMARMPRYK